MKLISTLILLASLCKLITCSGHFTVFGSKFLTRNGKYSLAITSRNFTSEILPDLQVTINSRDGTWRISKNVTLNNNGENQNLVFDMKDQPDDDEYELSVISTISDPVMDSIYFLQTVTLYTRNVLVIVQTDKAIYRADDRVQFRVLILNENLQPIDESSVHIYVKDSANYRIKQFDITVDSNDVFQGELQLSDSPMLGKWYIVVSVRNKIEAVKAFTVSEYTLPIFHIQIDAKPHVNYNETIVSVMIIAKYTFGAIARGNVTITAEVERKRVEKSLEINGNASVEFHIENELGIRKRNKDRIVRLFVTFIDKLTGRKQNATANVQLHVLPYKITMKETSKECKPGLPFTVEVFVQYHENNSPVNDTDNPISFTATLVHNRTSSLTTRPLEIYPINGISKISIPIPADIVKLSVTAKYLQTEISEIDIPMATSDGNHFIKITSKTESPTLSKNICINIQSVKTIQEFSYYVLTMMGRVIIADTIQISPGTKNYDFEFSPTLDMEADMKIIVFYSTDYDEIVSDSILFELNELRNFVDISVPDERVSPNDLIEIGIKSNHGSFVGLMGVDQSVLILESGNDISDSIFDKNEENVGNTPDVFFIMFTANFRLVNRLGDEDQSGYERLTEVETPTVKRKELRTNFLETWLFENINLEINETDTVIIRKVPDSITSFIITAFSLNPVTGLALTKTPTKLSVFKPLFISIDLPHSVQLGEVISIPISVFNYRNYDQDTKITMYNKDSDFEFVDADEKNNIQGLLNKGMTKNLIVKGQNGALTSFNIRASRIGSIKIKVVATSTLSAGDWIERNVLVKAEGSTQFKNKVILIDVSKSGNYTEDIYVSIPPQAISNSIRIEATIVGDIMGLPMGSENYVNNLITLHHANSEQNMITFVRNMAILDYLNVVGEKTSQINDVTKSLEIAYQKHLRFRHNDGSFSSWRNPDDPGSTWLTALVAKYFRRAAKHIFIDESIIKSALYCLSQKQSEDGSFVEDGYVDLSDRIALTAHTLITFLENTDYIDEFKNTSVKSLRWLTQTFHNITDNYSMAIVTYALQLANEPLKNISLSKLEQKAIKDGETMHWEVNNSFDVATTAYALHAFIEAGRSTDSARVMKSLVLHTRENIDFSSIRDAAIGLQVMSKLAANMYSPNTNIEVTIEYSGNMSTIFNVNKTNALLQMKTDLPTSERRFKVTATGEGFGFFQIAYQYNIDPIPNEKYKFNISRVIVNSTAYISTFYLKVCINNIPDAGDVKSNLTVMEVNFPSGCTLRTDLSNTLESAKEIKHVDVSPKTSVVVYISNLSVASVCSQFLFSRNTIVGNLRPASINVYDFGNIRRKARTFYSLPST